MTRLIFPYLAIMRMVKGHEASILAVFNSQHGSIVGWFFGVSHYLKADHSTTCFKGIKSICT